MRKKSLAEETTQKVDIGYGTVVFVTVTIVVSCFVLWYYVLPSVEKGIRADYEFSKTLLPNAEGMVIENAEINYWDCRRPEIAGDGCVNYFSLKGVFRGKLIYCTDKGKELVTCVYLPVD